MTSVEHKNDTLKVSGVHKILDSTDFPFMDTQYPQNILKKKNHFWEICSPKYALGSLFDPLI